MENQNQNQQTEKVNENVVNVNETQKPGFWGKVTRVGLTIASALAVGYGLHKADTKWNDGRISAAVGRGINSAKNFIFGEKKNSETVKVEQRGGWTPNKQYRPRNNYNGGYQKPVTENNGN